MQDKDVLYAIELKKLISKKISNNPELNEMSSLKILLEQYIDICGTHKETAFSDYRAYEEKIHHELVNVMSRSGFPDDITALQMTRKLLQAELDRKVDASLLSYDIYNRLTGYLNSSYSDMLTSFAYCIKDRNNSFKHLKED